MEKLLFIDKVTDRSLTASVMPFSPSPDSGSISGSSLFGFSLPVDKRVPYREEDGPSADLRREDDEKEEEGPSAHLGRASDDDDRVRSLLSTRSLVLLTGRLNTPEESCTVTLKWC